MAVIKFFFVVGLCVGGMVSARDWGRDGIDFAAVREIAEKLASEPYEPTDEKSIPRWTQDLNYDEYRSILFNEYHTLWARENLPFRTMFFHPGYLYQEPVILNEVTDTHKQRIRLSQEFFHYGHLTKNRGPLPSEGGFGGFKVLSEMDDMEGFDELAAFQGASYWRGLGMGQQYGLSARGVAVDTGVEGAEEEFPTFREFWLKKPRPGEEELTIFALLDGPSLTGAYVFRIDPGEDTVMNVTMVLFPRRNIARLGIAPMSSMFWFGENSRRRFDDFRPEVHDSDGLAVRTGSGESIWRPISNDSSEVEFSFFKMEKCVGFGLLQRDRSYSSYEDLEADYHLRPSLWIEPTSDWGPGSVMLMEIPTGNEVADNTAVMWVPARAVRKGQALEFSLRQTWTANPDPSEARGHVVASRTGIHEWQVDQRTMVVEFAGENLKDARLSLPQAVVEVVGEGKALVDISYINIQMLPDGRVRLVFQITPKNKELDLGDLGPVELRAALKRDEHYLTETWSYRIDP